MADRNMCTLDFLGGIAQRQAFFLMREHQNLPWQALSDLERVGQVDAGEVWEQTIQIQVAGVTLSLRRVVLRLRQPTRHGDGEIVCLTNLLAAVVGTMGG